MTRTTTPNTTRRAKTKKATKKAATVKARPEKPDYRSLVLKAIGKRPITHAQIREKLAVAKVTISESKVRDVVRGLEHDGEVVREALKTPIAALSGRGRKIREGFVRAVAEAGDVLGDTATGATA
jgi:hypothetical protein